LQERVNDARHELQQAQEARDAVLLSCERETALAARLETECESLRKQQLADATLRERTAAELSIAETRNQELTAEVQSLLSERQHAQAIADGCDEQRHRCSVLEEECEERRAELASKQKKIKSLQREVKRLEQLACSVKDAPARAEEDVQIGSIGSGQAAQHSGIGMVSHRPGDDITNSAIRSPSAEAAGSLRRQVCLARSYALVLAFESVTQPAEKCCINADFQPSFSI
jgi:uncharacterized protein (DUF3084 family)